MKQLSIMLTIGWLVFIFYQGTRTGEISMAKSNEIVTEIVKVIEKIKPAASKNQVASTQASTETSSDPKQKQEKSNSKLQSLLSYVIRKAAHFVEYLILAILLYWTFSYYPLLGVNRIIYSLFIVLFCAVLDEYLQSFVARTSSVSDVLLDFIGGSLGIAAILIFNFIKKN